MSEDTREATGFATYKGDVRSILNDPPKGRSYMGEYWFPLTAEYDPETNKTRVGFTLEMPPEMKETNQRG